METIIMARPYVEKPLVITVIHPDGEEPSEHRLSVTADAIVVVHLCAEVPGTKYGIAPNEARAIAAGLLEVADEADARQAVLDAQAKLGAPTVVDIKDRCAQLEVALGGVDGDVWNIRRQLGIDLAADITTTRLKKPGALRYLQALEALEELTEGEE